MIETMEKAGVLVRGESEGEKFKTIFSVEKVHFDDTYGNGNYVYFFELGKVYPWKIIDCRYVKNFRLDKIIEKVIIEYYGKNLLGYTIAPNVDGTFFTE